MHAAQNPTTPYEVFRVLIENGADVNLKNHMHRSAFAYLDTERSDFKRVAKLFIENGAVLTKA